MIMLKLIYIIDHPINSVLSIILIDAPLNRGAIFYNLFSYNHRCNSFPALDVEFQYEKLFSIVLESSRHIQ